MRYKKLPLKEKLARKRKYRKEYVKKNRKKVYETNKKSWLRNRDRYIEQGWFHYTKGKKCKKCGIPITNYSTGKCLKCTLTKEVKKDIDSYLYRQRNPEKIKARKAIYQAVKLGRIKRLPCIVCGKKKTEAHHADYSKPLEIIWYCKKHHFSVGHNKNPLCNCALKVSQKGDVYCSSKKHLKICKKRLFISKSGFEKLSTGSY